MGLGSFLFFLLICNSCWAQTKDYILSHPGWYETSRKTVYIVVTTTYDVEDLYFKRLAFFIDKKDTRGKILEDKILKTRKGWYAYDYSSDQLASFFNEADSECISLNSSELEMKKKLIELGLIKIENEKIVSIKGAVISISLSSDIDLRSTLYNHEFFHGLYFTSSEYKEKVLESWFNLSEKSKNSFKKYLGSHNYDTNDEELMANEFQAYLLEMHSSLWKNYIKEKISKDEKIIIELIGSATKLNDLVLKLFNLKSGLIN